MIEFPISGVETYWWLPPLVAFLVSALASTGGLSGAFILLPFQVSILGFASPAVTPTNLVFNAIAIPGGVYRFCREKRMLWRLLLVIILGSLPGLVLGAIIRVQYLPDPAVFKFFIGLVLLYIGSRLGFGIFGKATNKGSQGVGIVLSERFEKGQIYFEYNDETHQVPVLMLFLLSTLIGVIGGIYGIGGGAILIPILVAIYRLPVYTISGAALAGTFVNSVAGVAIYYVVNSIYSESSMMILPDWLLGLSLGIGGLAGIYMGATIQKYMPVRLIKTILTVSLLIIAFKYIWGYLT